MAIDRSVINLKAKTVTAVVVDAWGVGQGRRSTRQGAITGLSGQSVGQTVSINICPGQCDGFGHILVGTDRLHRGYRRIVDIGNRIG